MRRTHAIAALTLGLTLALAPSVASAYGNSGGTPDPSEPSYTASYLYQKLNADQPAAWVNSGPQPSSRSVRATTG